MAEGGLLFFAPGLRFVSSVPFFRVLLSSRHDRPRGSLWWMVESGTLSLFQNRTKSLFFLAKSVFQIFFLVKSLLLFASNQFCASSHYYKSSQAIISYFSGQVSITFSIGTIISKPSHIIISKPSHINISRPSHIIISKPSHILVLLQFLNVVASLFPNMVTLKFQN